MESSYRQSGDYQVYVARGISSREKKDGAQWELGYLASQVEVVWGEASIKDYADDINIGYSTIRGYRQLVGFYLEPWGKDDWKSIKYASRIAELRESPTLTFTHFRYAMRMGELIPALSFLDECVDETWCTDLAYAILSERLGKPQPPVLVGSFDSAESALRYLKTHPGKYSIKIYQQRKQQHAERT